MRLPDWERRLNTLIEAKRHEPFVWGQHDCLTFANAAHRALTGRGFCDDWLGGYQNARTALLRYRMTQDRLPFADIIEAMDSRLTRSVERPRGSLIARRQRGLVFGWALGVIVGRTAGFVGKDGLVFNAPQKGDVVWTVE